jgi:hypothetical protein
LGQFPVGMGAVKASYHSLNTMDCLVKEQNQFEIVCCWQSHPFFHVNQLDCLVKFNAAHSCIWPGHLEVVNEGMGRYSIGKDMEAAALLQGMIVVIEGYFSLFGSVANSLPLHPP